MVNSYLTVDRIKIFSDGSLGAETAAIRILLNDTTTNSNSSVQDDQDAMLETVFRKTGTTISDNDMQRQQQEQCKNYNGLLMYSDGEMESMISVAMKHDYRLEIHAIGDAAAEQVLKAMEKCGVQKSERAVLTHCQV